MSGPRAGAAALVGWTNVGKSTLLNRLVGHKLAAVADHAQTTRRRLTGVLRTPRGELALIDTPGLHRPRHRMNRRMVQTIAETLAGVDVAVLVVDAERGFGAGDREAAAIACQACAARIGVLSKIDRLADKRALLPAIAELASVLDTQDVVPLSARTGDGCALLVERVFDRLPEGPPAYAAGAWTVEPEREIAAEWIREKLLAETRAELPHATAVRITEWTERADGLLRIAATVLVDRVSQRRIVIGHEGAVLKRVGTAARQELEALLSRRVHLELWVDVEARWRDDRRVLAQLGLD